MAEADSVELVTCYNCADCDGSCGCGEHDPEPPVAVAPPVTMAMIVALGENNLAVPCLTFATVDEAEAFLTVRFGNANKWGRWVMHDYGSVCDYIKDFFLEYNDGCGGIYSFEIHTVKAGKPIVSFDLD
jgi:hypothetical protein